MANRVFQNVVYQMKDAVDRVVGVIDETGTVISCSELGQIGEVREGVAAVRQTAGDAFVRDGYAYHQFSNAKHNDYAVFVEGTDTTAEQFAAMLSISLQSIKQYHDEKFDKTNFIKNVVLDNILPGDIYAKARELHFVSDVQRVVLLIRVTSGNDISAYDVVSGLFPDKQKTSSLISARPTPSWSRRSSPTTTPAIWKSWLPPSSIRCRATITSRPSSASVRPSATSRTWPPALRKPDRHGGRQGV